MVQESVVEGSIISLLESVGYEYLASDDNGFKTAILMNSLIMMFF